MVWNVCYKCLPNVEDYHLSIYSTRSEGLRNIPYWNSGLNCLVTITDSLFSLVFLYFITFSECWLLDSYISWAFDFWHVFFQGHPTTVFWEISVRSPLECLKISRAQEQLKISKLFVGLRVSGFVWLVHLRISDFLVISRFWFRHLEIS